MKRLLLFFFFLALLQTHGVLGQDSLRGVSLVVSPALFVPVSVAVQPGVQVKLNRRWAVLVEGAFPSFHPTNTEYEKIEYWRGSLEVKYYQTTKGPAKYISLHNSYLHRQLTEKEGGRYYTKTQTFAYNNAIISSPVWATAVKIGIEVNIGRRAYFDLFAGAGVRQIFTSYKSENAAVTSVEPNRQSIFSFDDAWLFNYTLRRLHATAGVRFGFQF